MVIVHKKSYFAILLNMNIKAFTTARIEAYDDFYFHLFKALPDTLPEESVVVISSKIVALCEGSVVEIETIDKDELIKRESDMYLDRSFVPGKYVMHTFKNNMIMPSAGIDASNTGKYYALLPRDPYRSAQEIHYKITEKFKLNKLGIVISDSRSTLLRKGVVGYALSFFGFNPMHNYRGSKDLYHKKMNVSQSNIPDSLAAAAVFVMGEGTESTPIAVISDIPRIEFNNSYLRDDLELDPKEDIYIPFFRNAPWKNNQE